MSAWHIDDCRRLDILSALGMQFYGMGIVVQETGGGIIPSRTDVHVKAMIYLDVSKRTGFFIAVD